MTNWALMKRNGARAAALGLAVLVGGCSLFSGPEEIIATCPTTGVLAEGEKLERYTAGSERDLTDLRLKAQVGGVRHVCSILVEERKVQMDLVFQVFAERGPATAVQEPVRLAYFVAIVDDEQRILSREEFPLEVAFPGTARQASFSEELFLTLPVAPAKKVQDYKVFIGLQLSPDELNRALAAETAWRR